MANWLNIANGVAGIAGTAMSAYGTYQGVKNQKAAVDAARQQDEWARQRYNEQKAIYGDIEQNLANYYKTLTPEKKTSLGLDRYDQQFRLAQDKVAQTMAQRGLTGSGIEAEANYQMELQAAKDRAEIANQTEDLVRQQQLGFLGYGTGQTGLAAQMMANSNANYANALGSSAASWLNIANQAGNSAADAFGALMYNKQRNGQTSQSYNRFASGPVNQF